MLLVKAVFVDGCDRCDLYRLLLPLVRGVVMSLFGNGGSPGLSGASVEGENGGGDRLPWRLFRGLTGMAAAERTFRMLLAR